MADLLRGVVKWFNNAKGFGFIEHESGRDVFVHYSVIETEGFKTLKDGEEVEYQLGEGDKGLHAARVVRKQTAVTTSAPLAANIEAQAIRTTVTSSIEIEQTNTDSELNTTSTPREEDAEKTSSIVS